MWLKVFIQALPYIFKGLDFLFKYLSRRMEINKNKVADREKDKKRVIQEENFIENNRRLQELRKGMNWWVSDYHVGNYKVKKLIAEEKGQTDKSKKIATLIDNIKNSAEEKDKECGDIIERLKNQIKKIDD